MRISAAFSLRMCVSAVIAASAVGSAVPSPVAPAMAEQAAESSVIVILRDQLADMAPARHAMSARAAALAASQSSLIGQLQRIRPRTVKSFSTINAFAARMSAAEAAQLATQPSVLAVVPDRVLRAPSRRASVKSSGGNSGAAPAAAGELCNTLEPEALQLTHTAFLDSSKPQAQEVRDGNGKPITGVGVKVAFIADGIDPNVAGFIRPDGSHVFIDYQDFSGDPAGTPTAGGEAFGDASSIAAQDVPRGKQLNFDISKFVNAAHPLPSPCNIHIRGMAPGASLVGLKVFSNLGYTTTSGFVQAIEYAVVHDDVDVINESFGDDPYPDTSTDPTSLANAAAVKAGVTVTVSTGDAGSMGTLESPATDAGVIAVGSTTQYRLYAQTGYYVQPLAKGYVDNNIAAFSSGGFGFRKPTTVDVVAPGDSGWALCSTNEALFNDCTDFESPAAATAIEDFGGTSESSPLTAGEAALVIQAYRSTHHGADPSPALVRRIIMSTATDLGAPTSEQGAGLINALAAVEVALSIGQPGESKSSAGLLANVTSVAIVDAPNTRESKTFTITNDGASPRQLTPRLKTLGTPFAGSTFNLQLNPSGEPTFLSATGASRSYIRQKFTVPAGASHLDAALAFQGSLASLGTAVTPYVYLALLDPSGRQVQYSEPQQSPPDSPASGYAHVDVVQPVAGVWTAIIFTRTTGSGVYTGPVQFTWAAERYVDLGSVHPATFTLAPGASQSFTADFFTPSEPGDLAAGIRFAESGNEGLPEIPVTMRTLVPLGPTGGTFSGTLTGGNGRAGSSNSQLFEFDVPPRAKNMSVVVPVADNGYLLEGLLVDPNGMELSVDLNVDPSGALQYALQNFRANPQPGRWKFILLQDYSSSGNQTALPFTARIGLNMAEISANGLPNNPNTLLSASGAPVMATINVVNSGATAQSYFADARLTTLGVTALAQQPACTPTTLPGTCGLFYVPPEVNTIAFIGQSTAPIQMDAYNVAGFEAGGTGSPDLFAKQIAADTVAATLTEPEIPYGPWIASPSLVGPYGAAGAPTKPVTLSAYVLMQPFDTALSADSGDIWADLTLGTNTYNPLVISSGDAGTITLTITPDATEVGKTISGYVYVDTFNVNTVTGDEVVRIPYSYTIAP